MVVSESYQRFQHKNSNRKISEFQGELTAGKTFPSLFFFLPPVGNLASCTLQTFSDLEPGRTHPCKHTKQSKKPGVQLNLKSMDAGRQALSALSSLTSSFTLWDSWLPPWNRHKYNTCLARSNTCISSQQYPQFLAKCRSKS